MRSGAWSVPAGARPAGRRAPDSCPVNAPDHPRGLGVWLAGARPRTLPAAVVPVAVGTAAAVGTVPGGLIWWRALAALVVSLALQVATNYANDYSDGVRGTDADDRRVGPVRLVGQGLASPGAVKRAALAAFAVAGVVGTSGRPARPVAHGWRQRIHCGRGF